MHATAQALKKDIAELKAAIQSGDPKAAAEALASTNRGAYAQQLELAKAYLFRLSFCFSIQICFDGSHLRRHNSRSYSTPSCCRCHIRAG